jgi:hypothetical protein
MGRCWPETAVRTAREARLATTATGPKKTELGCAHAVERRWVAAELGWKGERREEGKRKV